MCFSSDSEQNFTVELMFCVSSLANSQVKAPMSVNHDYGNQKLVVSYQAELVSSCLSILWFLVGQLRAVVRS